MIKFVNAKINLGLYVTGKRADGYHDLSTVFYPVGLYNGTPENPEPFCDILEVIKRGEESLILQSLVAERAGVSLGIIPTDFNVGNQRKNEVENILSPDYEKDGFRFFFKGRNIDCPPEKNLIVKGATALRLTGRFDGEYDIILEKHLPDGAGMGGGSADCGILLSTLNEYCGLSKDELKEIAVRLGADCPFFIDNVPSYAEGIGEKLIPIDLKLSGMWALIVKPDIFVSTAEAFRGITPRQSEVDLRQLIRLPIEEWKDSVKNMFEETIFALYPEMKFIKDKLYESGALYASMSGSGSSFYGIFRDEQRAGQARALFKDCYTTIILL